ncbi:Uncharacterized protein HZ326_4912 [Fusarium oxysporum f. sp. albedinis]|nr:Uncharacterized protein HZ326_4912 [Fusarium oxysporum f. sp. albedinis]
MSTLAPVGAQEQGQRRLVFGGVRTEGSRRLWASFHECMKHCEALVVAQRYHILEVFGTCFRWTTQVCVRV